jgi:hypothetical protein
MGCSTPERAVVVKRGDAFRNRHKIWPAFLRHLPNKLDDGCVRQAIVPRGQRAGGAGEGLVKATWAMSQVAMWFCLRSVALTRTGG